MTDHELLRQLEERSLPFDQWTHRAHVRVAFRALQLHPFADAADRVRAAIRAYNAHHRLPEGPTSGYNETTTVAFLHLVDATMRAYGDAMPTADGEAFRDTHPHLMHRQVLRLFRSPERRILPAAKAAFVEPDLTPFPTAEGTSRRTHPKETR